MDIIKEIIGFAKNYWPVVLLLVTWLFSISQRNQPKSENERMPDFGGSPGSKPTIEPVRPMETHRHEARDGREQLDSSKAERNVTRRGTGTTERMSRLSMPALRGRERMHSKPTWSRTRAEANYAAGLSLLDPKEIRKGIVWSEIIGPARAKRPYGRRP